MAVTPASDQVNAFHGVLLVTICEAAEIENEHRHSHSIFSKLCGCYDRQLLENIQEVFHVGKGLSKLYVTVDFGIARLARTRVVKHSPCNPVWNESFHLFCAYELGDNEGLTIHVKDNLPFGAMVVGKVHIHPTTLLSGEILDGWFDICSNHDCSKKRGKLLMRMQFVKVENDPYIRWGGGVVPDMSSVRYAFFREEKGNNVRLYQDAHMHEDFIPPIILPNGFSNEATRCWEDLFKAILQAKHIIYIAGWSLFTKITLVRDMKRKTFNAEGVTLGELLKLKSEEGVQVLLLVWDDQTSVHVLGLRTSGIMHTHDENTGDFFRGSKVQCVLCPRNPDDGASIVQGIETRMMFTHHQKTVVVDIEDDMAESKENKGSANIESDTSDIKQRRLIAFVGGIDVCDGRYDTQSHSLFHSLGTLDHKDDFHQPNFEGASRNLGGPREPWHDVHAMVEGPCAWDILYNFEQRWRRQAKGREAALKNLKEEPELWPPPPAIADDDEQAWNVQVFRSIDEGAVVGFPHSPDSAAAMGLVTGKEHIIDRSIQDAYICAIRRAQHFIYIENQYFLGASQNWSQNRDAGAAHLIPMELTMKIVKKIEAGERFAVYVLIPLWPEGVPESASVQDILRWQHLTMEMMYQRIAGALRRKGMHESAKPTDYLNFFCLGNRETHLSSEYQPPGRPHPGSDYSMAQHHRRFMIYVHAKTMIVDDEYIIVGSANCNQRSMDGGRDSEIAIGAYQPHNLIFGRHEERPKGKVYAFRLSLWYEHIGELHDEFSCPESIDCVHKVQARAQHLWNVYTQNVIAEMKGHLLLYPISVCPNGDIVPLHDHQFFPDTKARVFGSNTPNLPCILTV